MSHTVKFYIEKPGVKLQLNVKEWAAVVFLIVALIEGTEAQRTEKSRMWAIMHLAILRRLHGRMKHKTFTSHHRRASITLKHDEAVVVYKMLHGRELNDLWLANLARDITTTIHKTYS